MKSDKLFHEYFRLVPQAFFDLLQISPGCDYEFTSPVLKETERRLDGLLLPTEPGYPIYFAEMQGYYDLSIYWRALQQMSLFFTQQPHLGHGPWQVVILFLDKAYDPGPEMLGPLYPGSRSWLTRAVLFDLLEAVEEPSPILHVLRPLVAEETTIRTEAAGWLAELRRTETVHAAHRERLGELLVQLVIQRFREMSRQEIEKMLELTPIEETRAVREWIEQGIEQGIRDSILDLLTIRFGQAPGGDLATRIKTISNPAELRQLLRQAAMADSLPSFEQELAAALSRMN